jgi:hypothetical protein
MGNVALPDGQPWGGHIAIRSEDVLANGAATNSGSLSCILRDVTYRGTVLDYLLELPDGQRLTATMTRRLEVQLGSSLSVSVHPTRIIPLYD